MTRHHIRVLLTVLVICAPLPAQVTFLRTYGSELADEYAFSVQQTRDDGYVLAGCMGDSGGFNFHPFLIKTDSLGDTLWTRSFDVRSADVAHSVLETDDGGYIVAGGPAPFSPPGSAWLIKTDSLGDTLWTRTFGWMPRSEAASVQQTDDGGYVVAGGPVLFFEGGSAWLIKADKYGDTTWTRTWGGPAADKARSVRQTSDGGYIIAGLSRSFGAGGADAWLIKTDSLGDTLWTRTYGTTDDEFAQSVASLDDGGYVLAGLTTSFGAGDADVWLIRTDSLGDTVWTRTFGRPYRDEARSVQRTSDGGFILACNTDLYGSGTTDDWLIKTDSLGDSLWTGTYGSTAFDWAGSAQQTRDGGYVMAGWTIPWGLPWADILLVKTDSLGRLGVEEQPPVAVRPTPSATVCRGILRLTADSRQLTASRLELLDVAGRVVLTRPLDRSTAGPLSVDVCHLAPGAYFVRSGTNPVRKVLIVE